MKNPFRGLFGASARMVKADPQRFQAYADPELDDPITRQIGAGETMTRAPVLTRDVEGEREDRARRMALFGAGLSDAGAALRGGQGDALARVQEGYRKRAKEDAASGQMEQLRSLAGQLYGDDPEAQLLFMADPESFVKARSERLKPRVMSGGQTYDDPLTGRRYTAPSVEKMDDRFAFYDPETGEARYSAPRGPTFQEETGRMTSEEARRHNRAQEGIGYGNLGVRREEFQERRRQGGFGTPGGAGGWEEF